MELLVNQQIRERERERRGERGRERDRISGILTSLALANGGGLGHGVVGGGVTGGSTGEIGGGGGIAMRLLILRQIVQAHTLPYRIHRHSDAEQHDLAGAGIRTVDSARRATARHLATQNKSGPYDIFWWDSGTVGREEIQCGCSYVRALYI